jgi:acetylornithine deacetylase/succinyl-diaminopimelate desuccinylase-like protein
MAWYKVLWTSDLPAYYTPYLPERTTPGESPNMIVRAAVGVKAIEEWAAGYQKRYAIQSACGPIIPKAQVGAIRGGESEALNSTPQVCAVYVGAFIVPGQDPLVLKDEIAAAVRDAGVPASDVECYYYHPGHEAKHADRIVAALREAHDATFDAPPPPPDPATNSMWRDINSFNEIGIPAITYGPRSTRHSFRRSFTIDALYKAAVVYARLILDICNQEKKGPSPFAR